MAIPIRITGLKKHVAQFNVDYTKLCKQFEYGATDVRISKDTGHSRPAIAKWRKQWEREQKKLRDDEAVENMRT